MSKGAELGIKIKENTIRLVKDKRTYYGIGTIVLTILLAVNKALANAFMTVAKILSTISIMFRAFGYL